MLKGKIAIHNRVSIDSSHKEGKYDTLDLIYTPGVAYVAKKISTLIKNWHMTIHQNGIMSPLYVTEHKLFGLGDIGPEGALPVMEGKYVLFKILGGINAFPLCIDIKAKRR